MQRLIRQGFGLRIDQIAVLIHAQLTIRNIRQRRIGEHPVFAQCLRRYDRRYRLSPITKIRVIGGDEGFLILQHGGHIKGQAVRNSIFVAVRHRNGQLNVVSRHIAFQCRHINVAALQCHGSDAFNLSGIDTILFGRRYSVDSHRVTIGTVRERVRSHQRLCC